MGSRSLLFKLQRKWRMNSGIGSLNASNNWEISKYFSSGTLKSEDLVVEEGILENEDDLKSRIFRLRFPKRSATNIIQKWVSEGNTVTASELRNISKELRKLQRDKHALEISEWMVSNKDFQLSDSDYAIRIDLMTKVFGIDSAERYFEGLPDTLKSSETYTALLHSYARLKLVEKAEELYERIRGSNLSFSVLTYNEMMTLYMSVGQVEKVSSVVEELKHQKITLDLFTYNLWISSCAATLNIDQVTRILDEIKHDPGCNGDWLRYVDIANIYIKAGHLVNGEGSGAVVEAEKGITQREWITYDFLIIMYAGLQNKDKVDQIWKSLRMTKQKMTNRNFICILSSYMILGNFKDAGDVLDQWKECTTTDFDISTCNRLLGAFSSAGMSEIADNFHMLLMDRNCNPISLSK